MPRNNESECGLVLDGLGARPPQKVALRCLSLPIPLILAGERPDRIGGTLRIAVFFYQARTDRRARLVVDRSGVFTAQAEGFKEPLADRGDGNSELAHAVSNDGFGDGR